jgi:hypothetical protein
LALKDKKILYLITHENFRDEELKIPKEILEKEVQKLL